MCPVAHLALDNAMSQTTFTSLLLRVIDELNRPLVGSQVTAVLVFANQSYDASGDFRTT
jgi:hypothetical protein